MAPVTAPRIQYARTSDGVSIGYWTLGEGRTPLVMTAPVGWSNIALEWQLPGLREWYQRLATQKMLVRFDYRNEGMSDRGVGDASLDAYGVDFDALVTHLALRRFDLVGFFGAVRPAIAWAAVHADAVCHLVLWSALAHNRDTFFRGDEARSKERDDAMLSLAERDWELATETYAHTVLGWGTGQTAHEYAKFMRRSISQADYLRLRQSARQQDVSPLLPKITAPTLVVQPRLARGMQDHSRLFASQMPKAQLVRLESGPSIPWENEEGTRTIEDFLRHGATRARKERLTPGFQTILFTDLVGHTAMMSRLGDERGRAVLREHETIIRNALKQNGGTELKTAGDGFMASFGSVTRAIECAIAFQRAFAERQGEPLSVRVGLNAGEPIEEEGDLFGATVILASRIAAQAEGGEILVADTVRGLCSGKGFLFADRGEFVAKGFEEPVRVYEVRWRDG